MQDTSASPRAGLPSQTDRREHTATETATNDELLGWVSLLKMNVTRMTPRFAVLNVFQKTPLIVPNEKENPFDMLDLASQFLDVPSSYFSDKLGGSQSALIPDRLRGLEDLQELCELARPENKLVLVLPPPSPDDYIDYKNPLDETALKKIRVLKGYFKPSSSAATTLGDDSGLAVTTVLSMRKDQLWFMLDNASAIVAREQSAEYKDVNFHARKPYEYAFKTLTKGVLSLSPDTALFKRKLEEMDHYMTEAARVAASTQVNHDLPLEYPPSYLYRCPDLPIFTVLTINELICEFSGIQMDYFKALSLIFRSYQVLHRDILPKLGKTLGVRKSVDFSELGEFLKQVKAWCEASPIAQAKQLLFNDNAPDTDFDHFVLEYSPSVLLAQVDKVLKLSEVMKRKIRIINTMCPVDGSKIHLFLINFKGALELILDHMRPIRPFLGDVNEQEVCSDHTSYLAVYAELRSRYLTVSNLKRVVKPQGPQPVSREQSSSAAESLGQSGEGVNSMSIAQVSPRSTTSKLVRNASGALSSPRSTSILSAEVQTPVAGAAISSPRRSSVLSADAQTPVAGATLSSPRRSRVDSSAGNSPREKEISGAVVNSPGSVPRSPHPNRTQGSGSVSRFEMPTRPRSPRHSPAASPRTEGDSVVGVVDLSSYARTGATGKQLDPVLRGPVVKKGDESMRRKSLKESLHKKVLPTFFADNQSEPPPESPLNGAIMGYGSATVSDE